MPREQSTRTRLVCQGFTKSAWMKTPGHSYEKLSVTDFSCVFNNTIIQSQAAMGYADSVTDVHRTKGPYVIDVPTIDLSLSFEIHRGLLKRIINVIAERRNESFSIKLTDHATNMVWQFDECYLMSFSFNVSENTILSVSMSFFVYIEKVNYDWNRRESEKYGDDFILPVQTQYHDRAVIPYYDWKLEYGGNIIGDVVNFDFSYTQSVEPKYECLGELRRYAPPAENLLFGMPQIEFSWSTFIGGKTDGVEYRKNYDESIRKAETYHDTPQSLDDDSVTLHLVKDIQRSYEKIMKITGFVKQSATPTWDVFPSIDRKFVINGVVKN